MDVVLSILAVILGIAGLVGCILPVIPGPPISYLALLVTAAASYCSFSWKFLLLWLIITVVVTMVDYYLPVFMTRRMGGSRYATAGTLIGMVAGFFILPPWGIIICPFLGAFIAELCFNKSREERAFRVAAGAFVAFLLGTGAKVVASATMFYYIIEQMI